MYQAPSESSISERRTQTRIQVNIPIRVTFSRMTESMHAINQDLSWGGALFIINEQPPQETGSVRLVLPWKQGEKITADAQLVRVKRLQNGTYLIAVRFYSLSPRSHARLEKLLKMLNGGQSSMIAEDSSGLVRDLEITVVDTNELRRMLAQIATGEHKVTVSSAYEENQSIRLSIAGTRGLPVIRLRARVIGVQKVHSNYFDWTDLYTLKLAFEHPKDSIRTFVDLLLNSLPETRYNTNSQLTDLMEPFSPTAFANSTLVDRGWQSGTSGIPCVLETTFPEALNHLTIGWGDVEAFETFFQDLTLGDQGSPGGWPADAWEELEFLQKIHDRAYGMSNSRSSVLKIGRTV
ncbi:pilus assembly protein PilZ [Chromatium weissei]|nr:pilus assembly protein PilZ [Chromatium weissei]